MKPLAALFLFVSILAFAQDRFEGTWEMKMDTMQLSGPPEEYLLKNAIFQCFTCVPKVKVAMNGQDQKVKGHSGFDTMSVRIVDANSVEFAYRKNGQPTFRCTETVSDDGNTMIEEFSENPSSERVTGHATFVRVAPGPMDAHALSGAWQMRTIRNVSTVGPMTTYHITTEGISVTSGSQKFEAKFDGREYPVKGQPGHAVSLKSIAPDTIEETEKQDGRAIRTIRMTVSQDDRSMKVETTDLQRGGRMTYTAEKNR